MAELTVDFHSSEKENLGNYPTTKEDPLVLKFINKDIVLAK